MGTYYYAVDTGQKQYFSPPEHYNVECPGCYHPLNPFPAMVVMKNVQGYCFEIWNDCGNDIPPEEGYKDITEEAFQELKDEFPNYEWDRK